MSSTAVVLILLGCPVIVYAGNRYLFGNRLNRVSVSALSTVLVYSAILLSVAYAEHKLDTELAAFDLNGDGFFSGEEITPEQEKALNRVNNDAGRNLAPVTGAIFSAVYFFTLWSGWSIIAKITRRTDTETHKK